MNRKLFHILLCLIGFTSSYALAIDSLNIRDKAALLHVMQASPLLQKHTTQVFSVSEEAFAQNTSINKSYGNVINYANLEDYLILNPQEFQFHSDSISLLEESLKAEWMVKTAWWNLYKRLREYTYQDIFNSTSEAFHDKLLRLIPKEYKSKKKKQALCEKIIKDILHPNLRMKEKIKRLSESHISDIKIQKKLLENFHKEVQAFIREEAQRLWSACQLNNNSWNILFLASGEGSGSAGLLNEYDHLIEFPGKKVLGKGVGLFTYSYKIRGPKKNKKLRLQAESETKYQLPDKEARRIHFDILGLNNQNNASLIVEMNQQKHIFYASALSQELSPEFDSTKGKNYEQLLAEFKHLYVDTKQEQLNAKWKRNSELKNMRDAKIARLSDLDTLIQEQSGIATEKQSKQRSSYLQDIDDLRSKIGTKQLEIQSIQKELSNKQLEYSKAAQKVARPVSFRKEGNVYHFASGLSFDMATQDFLIPASENKQQIRIQLLATGQSLKSKQVDEIQVFISDMKTNYFEKEPETIPAPVDKYFFTNKYLCFYDVNQFVPQAKSKDSEFPVFEKIDGELKLSIQLQAMGCAQIENDSIKAANLPLEKELAQYAANSFEQYRSSQIKLEISDSIYLHIQSFTDPVRTRLSGNSHSYKQESKNYLLSALRSYNAFLNWHQQLPDSALRNKINEYINKDSLQVFTPKNSYSFSELKTYSKQFTKANNPLN